MILFLRIHQYKIKELNYITIQFFESYSLGKKPTSDHFWTFTMVQMDLKPLDDLQYCSSILNLYELKKLYPFDQWILRHSWSKTPSAAITIRTSRTISMGAAILRPLNCWNYLQIYLIWNAGNLIWMIFIYSLQYKQEMDGF